MDVRAGDGRRGVIAVLAIAGFAGFASAEPAFDRGPGYAASPWASVHGDSRNSDYVPIESALELEEGWRVLEGTGVWTAPSVGLDGTIHFTTGRGEGTSHLHAVTPEGVILWESEPDGGDATLDSGAVTSAPVIDDAGDV